jgi:hypothetical protein
MNKIVCIALIALAFTACTQKSKTDEKVAENLEATVPSADAPKFKFEKAIYDFGVIKQGESVKYNFKFVNEGKTPLIITNATATCGCTIPDSPTEPIKPGESGEIKVVFNSAGKEGMQDKIITITSNASPEAEKLHLVGEVKLKQ